MTVVTESIWLPRARLRTGGSETGLRLSIRDTGQGISAVNLPKIFDPFFTTKSTGTGLGLSVSHSIFVDHDATVDVESTEGQGTTFTVSFPVLPRKEQRT